MKNVLIACEESQTVCKAFRKLGFNAFSCDILPCSGGHPEWHLHCDVLGVIRDKRGILETGDEFVLNGEWDLMIAHPPCTYLSVSGARWYYHPDDKDLPIEQRRPHPNFPTRAQDRKEAIEFFLALANADIQHIAIENPVGIMSKLFHKPNQIVQPYWFGDEATKTTCLWLKNLPQLTPTKIVRKGERVVLSSGKSLPNGILILLIQKYRLRCVALSEVKLSKALLMLWLSNGVNSFSYDIYSTSPQQ